MYPEMQEMIDHTENFDIQIGKIINIIVAYDMGWSRRASGNSYDSLNGYGAAIGFLSGKVIDYRTRNRKCRMCITGVDKLKHDCRLNYVGSAKGMEADVGAELMNNSAIMKAAKIRPRLMIGDDDSATIDRIRQGNSEKFFKLSDTNHLNKNFYKELLKLQPFYKELKAKGVIAHLKKLFAYAKATFKRDSEKIAATLRSIPDHVFGRHENCGAWCNSVSSTDKALIKHTICLKDEKLFCKLQEVFTRYADNSKKFAIQAYSQRCEVLNKMIVDFAPKNKSYSTSESADMRVAYGVLHFNDGNKGILTVQNILNVLPGKHTEKFAIKRDEERRKQHKKSLTREAKIRRNILKKNREKLRVVSERKEGTLYSSNMGITLEDSLEENIKDLASMDKSQENIEIVDLNSLPPETSQIKSNVIFIYYDLETSSFKDADILQIAAKSGEKVFSTYVTPTKDIDVDASAINDLTNVGEKLYYKKNLVETVPLHQALIKFYEFLKSFGVMSLLIAYNGNSFDHPNLIRTLEAHDMVQTYKSVTYGFCDPYPIFKKLYPERKGPGMMKLGKLACDLLQITGNLHEANFDVLILEKLCNSKINFDFIMKNAKSFDAYVKQREWKKYVNLKLPELGPLKKLTSQAACEKMIKLEITYDSLKAMYLAKGPTALLEYLSAKVDSRNVRVTNNEKYLNNILIHFSNFKKNDY